MPGAAPAMGRAASALLFVLAACALGLSLLAPSTADAAHQQLWTACAGAPGDVKCSFPRGIAAEPEDGHVFVADQFGERIVEYNALGQLVKSWGWDVVQSGPGNAGTGFEICLPGDGDICKAGVGGFGAGQLFIPLGIALDSSGNVYVIDASARVQKFSPAGDFLLAFGEEGSGPGQFGEARPGDYIAVGPSDKVYVGDIGRIQRFNTEGVYQDECAVSGAVQSLDVDAAGNLYVIYESQPDVRKITPGCVELEEPRFEVPKVGIGGEGPTVPSAVAVDVTGHVYVFCCPFRGSGSPVSVDPIFRFDQEGEIVDEFGKGEFSASTGLAANFCEGSEPPGNLYVSNSVDTTGPPESKEPFVRAYGTQPVGCFNVRTLPATEVEEASATLNGTVNPDGAPVSECRFEYGSTLTYGSTIPCAETPAQIGTGSEPVAVHADLSGLEAASVYHFRLAAKVTEEAQTGADEEFKTKGPPVITGDHTASVTDTEALLKALINPEGLATTYRFEFGPTAAYGQSTSLRTVDSEDRTEHPVSVILEDLAPDTIYHWRIVATNESGATEGDDHVFVTHPPPGVDPDPCPNRALRGGAAALLPDCRAYELVSPLDKNGGDIIAGIASLIDPGGYVQASPDGGRITYTALTSFGDQPNSFNFNQYLASREEGEGWHSEGIHPPVVNRPADSVLFGHLREFMAFTPDLCNTWLIDYQSPPLTPDAQLGYRNLFRRDNCEPGVGELEALTPVPEVELPEGTNSEVYIDQYSVQGISKEGRHALFVARAALIPKAAPHDDDGQVYDRFEGSLHVVSVLPHGAANPASAVVGGGWFGNLKHAVSGDGARVYWTSLFPTDSTRSFGRIFVRLNPEQSQSAQALGSAAGSGDISAGSTSVTDVSATSGGFAVGQAITGDGIPVGTTIAAVGAGTLTLSESATATVTEVALESFSECSEPAKACTVPVSAGDRALFWAATPDGSAALYSEGDLEGGEATLYEFSSQGAGGSRRVVAEDIRGVAGVSEGLSRVYFVSDEALAGAGKNEEGDEAQGGQPNLYLQDGGTLRFVATLALGDVGGVRYDLASRTPYFRATRVTPDGERIVFQSRAPITGYDNTDVANGQADVEVFLYEAGGELTCVSCNPSRARPSGALLANPYDLPFAGVSVFAAAWIPTWEHSLHASNVLSEDGRRLFFNSHDALLPRDTNGAMDVYEWEEAGKGTCTESDRHYFPQNGGCLYLISTGDSPHESQFWEATPDGRNVFFTTASSLAPGDTGLVDLYDARAGGGFPPPHVELECEGETCQSPPPPPEFGAPASSTYSGPENEGKPARKRCRKGKRRVRRAGKVRCVKKKAGKRRAGRHRRAGR